MFKFIFLDMKKKKLNLQHWVHLKKRLWSFYFEIN